MKMAQQALAQAIGITFQQVQKYENGTNRISASRLHQIVNALQVPTEFFFEGLPENRNTKYPLQEDYARTFMRWPDGPALAEAYMRITDGKLKRRFVALVEAIAVRYS